MIRTPFQIHPFVEPVAPRPAATVLLLRDAVQEGGQPELEVLMTQRSPTASFAPSVFVFPGGAVDPGESFEQAAVRECTEELAVTPDIALLRLQSIWMTDRDMPKRFLVKFYVAPMPADQIPVADEQEQFHPTWVKPKQALALHGAHQFPMIFPTIRTLEWLARFASMADVLQACDSNVPQWDSCPRSGLIAGKPHYYMEHDAPYGELAMVCPDGIKRHSLDWAHDRAIPLLKHVQRLTCGNPSMMTGPGTNTYIVGTKDAGFIVIDPGPYTAGNAKEVAHVERLLEACKNADGQVDIRHIICTHSHPDHSPAAKPLQALCATAGCEVQIHGMASGDMARAYSQFMPDVPTQDGDRFVLDKGDAQITLRAIHTPGHASNHICLALQEDGLLFTGDHILNGSTTVVDHPDGNMTDYMTSLDKLDAACSQFGIEYILPAHGHVLGFAQSAIAKLKAHRLRREAKVRAAMQVLPGSDLNELVAIAYDDVDPKLWPVALKSLAAHMEKLRSEIT